ncbi:MAG: AAA family ATPase [Planctomycetes bacterium]|nr:AAA family ATPase [Planctomycetota bacterium]
MSAPIDPTRIQHAAALVREKLHERIVGLDGPIELLLLSVFSGSHALLEGVPGLAKTLLVRTLAELLDLNFARIQFTPDLMPGDITGAEVIAEDAQSGERNFRFLRGPVFTNLLLADEINRTPPKTQAALMEAMEELQVTVRGERMAIEAPFCVLATQNPIEQEGTYPLPAAQLDRFLFHIRLDYPAQAEEKRMLRMTTAGSTTALEPVLRKDEIHAAIAAIRGARISSEVARTAADLVRHSRPNDEHAPEQVKRYVQFGAGPRAAQALVLAANARAFLQGRSAATPADVLALANHALRHRIIMRFAAVAEQVSADDVIATLVAANSGARVSAR